MGKGDRRRGPIIRAPRRSSPWRRTDCPASHRPASASTTGSARSPTSSTTRSRRFPAVATRERPVPGPRLRRARPAARALAGHGLDLRARGQPDRLLPLGRVPARPAPRRTTCSTSGVERRGAAGAARSWARPRRDRSRRRRSRGSATAASAGSPPATSTRSPRSRSPRSATASATSSASSTRRSATAGRSRSTDNWLRLGNPWEIPRPEIAFHVLLGGRTEAARDADGRYRVRWMPEPRGEGLAYDTPILGYRVNTANMLRLWSAQAAESFDFEAFNEGDYYRRRRGEDRLREHHQGPLPERRDGRRASSCGWSSSTSSSPARCRT